MEKVTLAQNFALMLEMIKAKGFSTSEVKQFLQERNDEVLNNFGEGIPSWETMIDFYHQHKMKIHQALVDGYKINFLTKGALKSLLSIKFGIKEGKDYSDNGVSLDPVKIGKLDLQLLSEMISSNWTIVKLRESSDNPDVSIIKIELTYKPVTNR
ncbi:hypothetical protein J6TS2_10060 [Heyndrickxia sporothermodurans]|nr:hypothetical protein J6TS2_10060 [Heyndrickxia sporothermodurans]